MAIKIQVHKEGNFQENVQTEEERAEEDYQVVKKQLAAARKPRKK